MTVPFVSGIRGRGPRSFALLTLLLLATLSGCKGDGLSDFEREQKKKEESINALRDGGAKITEKNYGRRGNGYVVDLSGAQLTDNTFQKLKEMRPLTELDLSKSSLSDDQMDKLNEVAHLLVKLDLSNTAVTDAGLEKLTNLILCFDFYLAGSKVTQAGAENFTKQRLARPATKVKKMNVHMK